MQGDQATYEDASVPNPYDFINAGITEESSDGVDNTTNQNLPAQASSTSADIDGGISNSSTDDGTWQGEAIADILDPEDIPPPKPTEKGTSEQEPSVEEPVPEFRCGFRAPVVSILDKISGDEDGKHFFPDHSFN